MIQNSYKFLKKIMLTTLIASLSLQGAPAFALTLSQEQEAIDAMIAKEVKAQVAKSLENINKEIEAQVEKRLEEISEEENRYFEKRQADHEAEQLKYLLRVRHTLKKEWVPESHSKFRKIEAHLQELGFLKSVEDYRQNRQNLYSSEFESYEKGLGKTRLRQIKTYLADSDEEKTWLQRWRPTLWAGGGIILGTVFTGMMTAIFTKDFFEKCSELISYAAKAWEWHQKPSPLRDGVSALELNEQLLEHLDETSGTPQKISDNKKDNIQRGLDWNRTKEHALNWLHEDFQKAGGVFPSDSIVYLNALKTAKGVKVNRLNGEMNGLNQQIAQQDDNAAKNELELSKKAKEEEKDKIEKERGPLNGIIDELEKGTLPAKLAENIIDTRLNKKDATASDDNKPYTSKEAPHFFDDLTYTIRSILQKHEATESREAPFIGFCQGIHKYLINVNIPRVEFWGRFKGLLGDLGLGAFQGALAGGLQLGVSYYYPSEYNTKFCSFASQLGIDAVNSLFRSQKKTVGYYARGSVVFLSLFVILNAAQNSIMKLYKSGLGSGSDDYDDDGDEEEGALAS